TVQLVKAPEPPILTLYDQTFTINRDSAYIIHGQTLAPGAQISLPPSIVIEERNLPDIKIEESPLPTLMPAAITIGGKPIYPNSAWEHIFGIKPSTPVVPE
ncbi:hypothetical protein MMC31_007014, partial [Peltigera leucophlebia]|nr:hypothetical protein [Peltigera leucophlebia]